MPMDASLLRSMVWEMVSKATFRSSRLRMVRSPESAARGSASVILMRAVSLLETSTGGNQTGIVHTDCGGISGNGAEGRQYFLIFWK